MDLSKIEIILVEDNYDDVELTLRAFQKHDLDKNVVVLKDGEEAMQFIFDNKTVNEKHFNSKTKVILLDLNLPKVSGMDILKKLKKEPATKSIPVVILTSSADDPLIKKCKELGASNYIVKPVTLEGFIEVVSRLGFYWKE